MSNDRPAAGHGSRRRLGIRLGLGLAATLTDDPDDAAAWTADAHQISTEGINQQQDNGVNPELGGHDVRYQMYGTWLATVYHSVVADGPHKDELNDRITSAIEWMDTMLDSEGVVDIARSTRTCVNDPTISEYLPYHALSTFLLWGQTQPGHAALQDLAALHDQGHRATGSPCP